MVPAADAGLAGAIRPTPDPGGQGTPSPGRWYSLPKPQLHLNNFGVIRW